MAAKQSNAELRREILEADKKKDVNIYAAVTIAVFSGISSASGALATLSVAFLESFRKDVELFWLACTPFCFPIITGISIAYRKQLASVGLHIALVLLTTGVGGAGYKITVDYIHFDKRNCTPVEDNRGECEREVLVYIYVISGMIASVCAVLGFLLSLCTCKGAMKRRAKRAAEEEVQLTREDERRAREVKTATSKASRPPMTLISSAPSQAAVPPAVSVTKACPPPASTPVSVTATATQTYQDTIIEPKGTDINGVNVVNGINDVKGIKDISDVRSVNGINNVKGVNGINDGKSVNDNNDAKDVNSINEMNSINDINEVKGVNGVNCINGINDHPVDTVSTHL